MQAPQCSPPWGAARPTYIRLTDVRPSVQQGSHHVKMAPCAGLDECRVAMGLQVKGRTKVWEACRLCMTASSTLGGRETGDGRDGRMQQCATPTAA